MVSNEEAALAKEQSVRDGINVDVSRFPDAFFCTSITRRVTEKRPLTFTIGLRPPKEYRYKTSQGRSTAEYADPRECDVGYDKECYCFRQLPGYAVCLIPSHTYPMTHLDIPAGLNTQINLLTTSNYSANEHAHTQNRKTLSTVDVFAALEELEFPDWKEKLEGELASESSNLSSARIS